MAGAFYLLAKQFAPNMPTALSNTATAAAAALITYINYIIITRRANREHRPINYSDCGHLLIVFFVTVGIMLTATQFVLAHILPNSRWWDLFLNLALQLLLLGIFGFQHDQRHRTQRAREGMLHRIYTSGDEP